ncbi:heat shock protein HspQ [Roseospirillum parvum]|uniref:Heat shock protein HspQ n=1 Tax=Roseospirillum parvum TaxID=83401 RepID=A0A1G7US43_9PROT|nr:heat shock protein HspQ [Roseospirillum parvum]SDG50352.1 heat shock protein HspQ [Roseospirillum parvum]
MVNPHPQRPERPGAPPAGAAIDGADGPLIRQARFAIGQVVRHRIYPFRGVVVDVDPEFSNTDEWYESIPADIRPAKDQPFYHLLAENAETTYEAYVSEQNLLPEKDPRPVGHPDISKLFEGLRDGHYVPRPEHRGH